MLLAMDDRRYLIPFRATLLPQIFTDVLVVGSGVAGLSAALEASTQGDVIVTTKTQIDQSSTAWAQGGIAAVTDQEDSFDAHVRDTLDAGAGLCIEPVVRDIVEQAPKCIDRLLGWGMRFDRASGGDGDDNDPNSLARGREGGHSHHRILHTDGDATGKALIHTLAGQARTRDNIRLFDQCFVLDLLTIDTNPKRCVGAITHHSRYGLQVIWASTVVLATGGCGMVYRETTNPPVVTGDGLAMAFRAGAELADMAFVQFHPTTLYVAGASRALITEAVRGEGAYLIDRSGKRFMLDHDERGELAPRDIVSRSIVSELVRSGESHAYLDVRHLGAEHFAKRFPGILKLLQKFDIDPATSPIPIHPSAHYLIGGVKADTHGRTNIDGLLAAGEVACTGLHGANRLASNSLLEGLVVGQRAGALAGQSIDATHRPPVKTVSDIPLSERGDLDLADVRSSLRSVMWRHVGIERDGRRLDDVAEMIRFWARYTMDKIFDEQAGWEVQNMLTVGALIAQSSRWRTESRGTHYRSDFAGPDPSLAYHDVWTSGQAEPHRYTGIDTPAQATAE